MASGNPNVSCLFSILIMIISLCFLSSATGNTRFNHTIGPLAICDGEFKSSREYVEGCFQRCNKPASPAGHGTLKIYSDSSSSGGPKVIHCSKIRVTQTFTETWTLSQITSPPIIESVSASYDECQSAIKKNCPNKDCNIRAPHELLGEFHFASDTKLTKEFISLITLPSSLDMFDKDLKLTPMGSKRSYAMSDERGEDGESLFLWDKAEIEGCPFDIVAESGCDYYDGDVDSYVCRSSRVVIDQVSKSRQLNSPCAGLKMSKGGIIYRWVDGAADRSKEKKKLYLTAGTSEAVDVALVRSQTGEALAVIDEDLCQIQCELLELVSRVNLGKEMLTRLGNSYALTTKTGYIRDCRPLTSCRVAEPHVYCGGPVRFGVICDGKTMMWNPLKSHIDDHTPCHSVMDHEKLQIAIGNKLYDVADDLSVNSSDIHPIGLSHDTLAIKGTKMSKEIINPESLRSSWATGSHRAAVQVETEGSSTHLVDHWDMFQEGWKIGGDMIRRVTDIATKAYFVIGVSITVGLLVWGYSRIYPNRVQDRGSHGYEMARGSRNRGEAPRWI
nr:TPA_asm: G [Pogostemom alphacytorhabdovirus 1_Pip]